MKIIGTFIIAVIIFVCTLSTSSCIKDLPRDNPLDSANNVGTVKGVLNFSSYQITGQYAKGSGGIYTTNTTVNSGDSTFLQINMINAGNTSLYGIKMNVSSNSGLIQITSIQSGYYIECNGDITYDYLRVGQIGYSAITNGTFYTVDPNSNFYAINFKVSNSAVTGNIIPFIIQASDNTGQQWSFNFNVTVN